MRALAILVALCSVVQLLAAVVFIGPHTDVPAQPATSFVVMVVALLGFRLARALWNRRPGAPRGLLVWGAGMALFVLGLVLVISSAAERREATPVLAAILPLWAGLVWLASRYARRRSRTST